MLLVRFIFLSVLSIVLMVVDHHEGHFVYLRAYLSALMAPIHYIVDVPVELVDWAAASFSSHRQLVAENASLQAEQLLLKAKLQKLTLLEKENKKLLELLESSSHVAGRSLAGMIIAVDTDPFVQQVVVDKGSKHGVYLGQPVLDAKGVMGQVVKVGPVTSHVIFLTDNRSAIPVEIARDGSRAIVVGMGDPDKLALAYMTETMEVRVGDRLLSSGLGQRYPMGYPVGQVESVEHKAGERFLTVKVAPAADFQRTRQVILVWPKGIAAGQSNPIKRRV